MNLLKRCFSIVGIFTLTLFSCNTADKESGQKNEIDKDFLTLIQNLPELQENIYANVIVVRTEGCGGCIQQIRECMKNTSCSRNLFVVLGKTQKDINIFLRDIPEKSCITTRVNADDNKYLPNTSIFYTIRESKVYPLDANYIESFVKQHCK